MTAKLRARYKNIYSAQEAGIIDKALNLAIENHEGQKRKSGEPYITHPIAVADSLLNLGIRYTAVAAALLHDVLEDTNISEKEMREQFGDEIVDLVVGVTKLKDYKFKSKHQEQAENFMRMFLAMSKDPHVLIIKLADRLHNMQTIEFLSPERQNAMAKETQEIYAPLAGRLGLSYIKCELEDLCLKTLKSDEYETLYKQVNQKRKKFKAVLDMIQERLREILVKFEIVGNVSGRPKHLYSIYRKMTHPKSPRTFEQIFDLTAVRVLVDTVPECYTVLGAVHDAWKPIKDRFKDFIAVPKSNNYRSLHTTVMTEYKFPCEIQIRTHDMHDVAEYGIAAHWMYKAKSGNKASESQKLSWLKWLGDVESEATTSEEFYEAVKFDFGHNEIFVFTPRGDIIVLPEGATPIDFAYRVHSEVGNRCAGCKVNSRIVPFETELKNGDYVEVLTSNNTKGPSRDWLRFVKTTQAISKIKAFFKKHTKEENIIRGKTLLENEAKRYGYTFSQLSDHKWMDVIMRRYVISNLDDLYAAVGYGGFTVGQIIPKLVDFYKKNVEKEKGIQNFTGKSLQTRQNIIVDGYDDLLVRIARCCAPAPGDEIVGFISHGRGIAVHRKGCSNLKHIGQERLMKTEWANKTGEPFIVNLQIEGKNSAGLLSKLTALVSGLGLFIHNLNARSIKGDAGIIELGLRVTNISQIDALILKIERIAEVDKVFRK